MSGIKKIELNNGELKLVKPQSYEPLTDAEIKAMGGRPGANNWVVQNKSTGIIFNITWKKVPFMARLATLEQVTKNTEKQVEKFVPTYDKVEDVHKNIAGQEAVGFRYTYVSNNVYMVSEYNLVKFGKYFYAVICMGRACNFDQNYGTFEKMLETVEWSK